VLVPVRVWYGRRPLGRLQRAPVSQQPFHPFRRNWLRQHPRVRGKLAKRRVRLYLNLARRAPLIERQVEGAPIVLILNGRVRIVMVLFDHLIEHAFILKFLLQQKTEKFSMTVIT